MKIKKLEMLGFKSFPEKVSLSFPVGITGIVGPNGCGKSNIVDAVLWVAGERSARHLRARLMEDVIFNGTDSCPPLNMAEVSITLSNESKHLAIDYDEVTITRRLYHSGESEYLLNKTLVIFCRRKPGIRDPFIIIFPFYSVDFSHGAVFFLWPSYTLSVDDLRRFTTVFCLSLFGSASFLFFSPPPPQS